MDWKVGGGHGFTFVQLGLGVFENVSRNARLVSTFSNLFLEHVKKFSKVDIPSRSVLGSHIIAARPKPEKRNVVLPIVARAPKVRYLAFYMDDFPQQLVVLVAIDANAIVQG